MKTNTQHGAAEGLRMAGLGELAKLIGPHLSSQQKFSRGLPNSTLLHLKEPTAQVVGAANKDPKNDHLVLQPRLSVALPNTSGHVALGGCVLVVHTPVDVSGDIIDVATKVTIVTVHEKRNGQLEFAGSNGAVYRYKVNTKGALEAVDRRSNAAA